MALMLSDGIREEDAQLRWVARKRRQKILGNVDYTAFIHEAALHVPFGGRETHRAQLKHLVGARERGIGVRIDTEARAIRRDQPQLALHDIP